MLFLLMIVNYCINAQFIHSLNSTHREIAIVRAFIVLIYIEGNICLIKDIDGWKAGTAHDKGTWDLSNIRSSPKETDLKLRGFSHVFLAEKKKKSCVSCTSLSDNFAQSTSEISHNLKIYCPVPILLVFLINKQSTENLVINVIEWISREFPNLYRGNDLMH